MDSHERTWNRLNIGEHAKLLKLLRDGRKVMAIKHVRASLWMDLKEVKVFVESEWLLKKVVELYPTMKLPSKEFKTKVLTMVTGMLTNENESEVLKTYWKLFDMCTED